MTIKHLHTLLTLLLFLAVFLTVSSAVVAIALPLFDELLVTTWQVQFESVAHESLAKTSEALSWHLEQTKGLLIFETSTMDFALSRMLTILLFGAVVIGIVFNFRSVVVEVSSARPFTQTSIQALQKLAGLLIALPVLLVFEVFIRFVLFIPDTANKVAFYFTHMQLTTSQNQTVLIYPDVQWGLLVAASFVLVMAKVFKAGRELQTDSDEII